MHLVDVNLHFIDEILPFEDFQLLFLWSRLNLRSQD